MYFKISKKILIFLVLFLFIMMIILELEKLLVLMLRWKLFRVFFILGYLKVWDFLMRRFLVFLVMWKVKFLLWKCKFLVGM